MQRSENLDLILFEGQDYVKRINFVENFEKLDKSYGNLLKNTSDYVLTTGNANTYLATLDRKLTSYYEGLCLKIKIHIDSTGNCTLNLNGLGAKYIRDSYGNIVKNLKKNIPYHVCYCEGDFILLGKGGGGNAQPIQVLENYTFTNDSGPQKGTMKNNGTKIFIPGRSNIALSGYYADGSYIKGEPNLIEANIVKGVSLFGINGNATIQSLGGFKKKSGTVYIQGYSGTPTHCYCGFEPKIIFIWREASDFHGIMLYNEGAYMCCASGGKTSEYKLHWCDINEDGFTVLTQFNVLYYNKEYNWIAFG